MSQDSENKLPSYVVGIGASAGGLEALERFFRAMPVNSGMAFVVIQHLSPDFKSLMNELLERFTTMPAIPVLDSIEVRPNTIFLLPPRKDITLEGNQLITRDRDKGKEAPISMPINTFFQSLAASWGDRAIAIVLSGTGSDGSNGILDVRDAGGLVLVQSPESASFDGMPQSAINTGYVDSILVPENMPSALAVFAANPTLRQFGVDNPDDEGGNSTGVPNILRLLKKHYNIDFSNYKPATIMRRIERRLSISLNGEDIETYSNRLNEDMLELNQLYKDLLIGVTRFFRDAEAFEILRQNVIPQILQNLGEDEDVRVWVCGCSTGEEAYSVAILFLEGFKTLGRQPQLKVLATDLHQGSLQSAAEGYYSGDRFADMPSKLQEAYFEKVADNTFKVLPHLRKSLIFSPHNVLKDPPFTKLHMVSCRNLLIYFQPNAQAKVIATFHYALKSNGVMFLGASETPGELTDEIETIDRQWKIYRKVRESSSFMNMRSQVATMETQRLLRNHIVGSRQIPRIYESLLSKYIPHGFLINEQREILHVFGQAKRFIHVDEGFFNSDILSLLPHALSLALSTALRTASKAMTQVNLKGICYQEEHDGPEERVTLTVDPFQEKLSNTPYFMVLLEPELIQQTAVPGVEKSTTINFDPNLESDLRVRDLELDLQKTRESLQSTVEELETTNEELQASNEELLASNEELQSTNEELHSVNEELYSVNAEHELKIEELNQLSSNLRNLMQSTEIATIFIDREHRIRLYTARAQEVFNLMPQDIGRNLVHFQPRYPDPSLFEDIERVMEYGQMIERHLDTGTPSYLRRCMSYTDVFGKPGGVVINYIDTTSISEISQALRESETQLRQVLHAVPIAILLINDRGEILLANRVAEELLQYPMNQLLGMKLSDVIPQAKLAGMRHYFNNHSDPMNLPVANGEESLKAVSKDGSQRDVDVVIAPVKLSLENCLVAMVVDVTERNRLEESRQHALQAAVQLADTKSRFLANMSHEIRTPLNAITGFSDLCQTYLKRNDKDKIAECLGKITISSKHLLAIVNDILDFSKLDASKMTIESISVDLRGILNECISMSEASVGSKSLSIKLEVDPQLPRVVLTDPVRLRQILMNLLSNAIKFTTNGGISLIATQRDERIFFSVNDTGVGIKPEDMSTLFLPFEQADVSSTRNYGGTGLGLVISQKLALLMDGEITVESEVGQGSRFTLSLPCRLTRSHTEQNGVSEADWAGLKGLRILLVEDVQFNLEIIQLILKEEGVIVTTAVNGLEAVNLCCGEDAQDFDLVLMDVQMPVMDGYHATREILAMHPDMPILGLTANVLPEDRQKCLKAGMLDHVSKPILKEQLFASILKNAKDVSQFKATTQ